MRASLENGRDLAHQQVVDLFHSFSLRGNLSLTTAELEMALSLVDGLEVTRREVNKRKNLLLPPPPRGEKQQPLCAERSIICNSSTAEISLKRDP